MRLLRFLLVVIILVVLLVAFVPFLNGWFFKQKYFELIQSLNADTEIKFEVRKYQLGWRHSTALVEVTIPNSYVDSNHFTLEQHIQHGPFIFNEKGQSFPDNINFQYALIDGVLKQDKQLLMNIHTNAYYSGVFNNQFTVPNVQIPTMMGSITWEGVNGIIDLKASNNHIEKGTMNIDVLPIVFQSPFGIFNTSKINVHNDFNYHDKNTFNSDYNLTISSLAFQILEYDVRLNQFKLTHLLNVKNNLYSSKTNFTIQQLAIPNLNIAPFSMTLNINNLNFDALMRFMKTDKKDITPELLLKSITPQSELTSTIEFSIPEGKFHLDFKCHKSEKDLNAKDPIADRINFNIHIVASKTLVNYLLELIPEKNTNSQIPQKTLTFNEQIKLLVEQNAISTYAASQLKVFAETPLAYDAFETAVNQLAMTHEISENALTILKQSYSSMQNQITSAPQPTQKEISAMQLNEFIKQGYILEEKDNYVMNIVNQNGVILINGKSESSFPKEMNIKTIPIAF